MAEFIKVAKPVQALEVLELVNVEKRAGRWTVSVETDRGEVIPVYVSANKVPASGDWVVFDAPDDVYLVDSGVFKKTYQGYNCSAEKQGHF